MSWRQHNSPFGILREGFPFLAILQGARFACTAFSARLAGFSNPGAGACERRLGSGAVGEGVRRSRDEVLTEPHPQRPEQPRAWRGLAGGKGGW